MSKRKRPSSKPLWHPGLWPAWLGVFLLNLLSRLSMPAKQRWGKAIGRTLSRRWKSRHRVAGQNIQACLPELIEDQQEQLVEDCFVACTRELLESTHAWWRDMEPLH